MARPTPIIMKYVHQVAWECKIWLSS